MVHVAPARHRVAMPQVRASFPRRVFDGLTSVALEAMGHRVVVDIMRVPNGGCRGGVKRWFRCGRCGAKTLVLWCSAADGWGCRRCVPTTSSGP